MQGKPSGIWILLGLQQAGRNSNSSKAFCYLGTFIHEASEACFKLNYLQDLVSNFLQMRPLRTWWIAPKVLLILCVDLGLERCP